MRRKMDPDVGDASRRASIAACSSTQRLARAASSFGHMLDESDGIPIDALDDDDSAVVALDVIVGQQSRKVH